MGKNTVVNVDVCRPRRPTPGWPGADAWLPLGKLSRCEVVDSGERLPYRPGGRDYEYMDYMGNDYMDYIVYMEVRGGYKDTRMRN